MRFVAFLLAFSLNLSASLAQDNCTLRKDDEGVKVYLCDNDKSNFRTIIVELEVPATMSQYAAQVLDVDNFYNWQYRVKNQKTLKQVSDTELFYYSEVSTPWPAADRDYIFHLKMQQDTDTKVLTLTLEEIPNYIPEKEGYVRVPYAESLLTVTPLTSETVSVRYVLDIDPGGDVPAWIINMFAASAPWNTYINFRNLIIEQGENRKEVDFIKNY